MTPDDMVAGGHALVSRAHDANVWAAVAERDGHPDRAQEWRRMSRSDLRSAIQLFAAAAETGAEECRRAGMTENLWQFSATLADKYREDLNDG